jgi:hypothetical protein
MLKPAPSPVPSSAILVDLGKASHAAILESNARVRDDLTEHPDVAVLAKEKIRSAEAAKTKRRMETMIDRQRDLNEGVGQEPGDSMAKVIPGHR